MEAKVSEAFAPAAISNFFAVEDLVPPIGREADLSQVGATGGGFTLSAGVHSKVTILDDSNLQRIRIIVNGDPSYDAKTTSLALRLLIDSTEAKFGTLILGQSVEVPIGYGFGASAASALSGVIAVSSALGLNLSKEKVAYFAHAADIMAQTGLGTVSVIYDAVGAGAITRPGGPGVAEFLRVKVPKGLKLVTASLAPYQKSDLLSSEVMRRKVNSLGKEALRMVTANPTFDTLLAAGESFARRLGLETREVRSLIRLAEANGASHSSQNMIGYAVHCVAREEDVPRLATRLGSSKPLPWVQVYDFGTTKAGVIRRYVADYPTVTSSLV